VVGRHPSEVLLGDRPAHRELRLTPSVVHIRFGPPAGVSVLAEPVGDPSGRRRVALNGETVVNVDDPAVLRDDAVGDADKRTQRHRVREGLPGRHDHRCVPSAEAVEEPRVDAAVGPGHRSVDVDCERRGDRSHRVYGILPGGQ
jgi:hypothetical protein